MTALGLTLLALPIILLAYAYVGYPALLWLVGRVVRRPLPEGEPAVWPTVTITVPAYNIGQRLRPVLDRLVALDYPRDRYDVLVISDASSDDTDDVAREYADRGVGLLRMPTRRGKTHAENAAARVARGEILVNVDATILIPRDSLKPLIRPFQDPAIGVASGRDVSVGADVRAAGGNQSESGYVGYEMWVRSLETRVGSIVGASGCFFACRRVVHDHQLPEELSWDFASALYAREHGYRAVSVDEAICLVPRTSALRTELRRKSRTMARGLATLVHKRALMNPARFGGFALALVSHKLVRWLPYLTAPFALVGLALLALEHESARWALAAVVAGLLVGIAGIRWPSARAVPRPIAFAGFGLAAFAAGALAWLELLRDRRTAVWDPTPRVQPSA
jgi:cellulose synthase/poly-beta-1,6-N-acetylglucosamine synthase-like glycosyltransferase